MHSADQRLTTAHVDQWKCDAEALARFVGEQLGLRTHGDVTLVVADTAVALADLLDFERVRAATVIASRFSRRGIAPLRRCLCSPSPSV